MIREPAFRHDRVREKKLTMAHRESGTRNQLTPCGTGQRMDRVQVAATSTAASGMAGGIGIRCPNHWPSGTPWCRRSAELDQVPVESAHQAGEAGSNPIADRTELVETGPGGSGDGQRFAPGISGLLAECVEERTHRLAIDLYVELEPPGAFAHSERLIWILLARSQLGDTLGRSKVSLCQWRTVSRLGRASSNGSEVAVADRSTEPQPISGPAVPANTAPPA